MSMLLDDLGQPLDDVVVLDPKDIDFPPQSEAIIARIRSWLNPTQYADYGSEYQKHLSSHLKGTGQWAIDSPIFQEWRDSHDQGILWIRGTPGAGKSVHAANLIHHLSQNSCPVLYFFFRHTIEANHRPEAALRDWLAQTLPFSPALQFELKDRIKEPVEKLKISDLSQLVQSALTRIPQAYCIVDALDEMDHTTLEPFLHMLDDLGHWRPADIKFIITSRPVAIVERIVRNIRLLDVRLDKELVEPDITVYLWHRLGQSCLLPDKYSAVVDYILGKADGLFLYAKLAMDAISHLEDDIEVQQALLGLPTDLTDMYSKLLQEHLKRTGIAPELQILILQCVTHAVRPLRLLEISDCIAVTQSQYGNDPGKLKALVRSACGPLLEVLPDETVRVVHHSLTEYLLGIIRPGNDTTAPFIVFESGQTHGKMAMLCLMYLHFDGLAQVKTKKNIVRGDEIVQEIYTPFTNYALTNWHVHIKHTTAFGHDLKSIDDYLHQVLVEGDKDNTRKLSVFAKLGNGIDRQASGRPPKAQAAALRLAIALDLPFFVESLLDRYGTEITNYDPDLDYSPLIFAVSSGNCNIVQSLICHGTDVNEYDKHGATPLHTAVGWGYKGGKGNTKMAEILLEAGADPEKDTGEIHRARGTSLGPRVSNPAFKSAFQSGDKNMAAIFMQYVNGATEASRALAWAISGDHARHPDAIDVILRHPDLDVNTGYGSTRHHPKTTPLYSACTVRDSRLIRKLLAAGADPNILHESADFMPTKSEHTDRGYNALHALANRGGRYIPSTSEVSEEETRECFRLVIAAGGDVHQVDWKNSTPLHEARDKVAARCLIEAGADINAKNRDGETPLHLLSDVDILEALADFFDINTKSSGSEQTLLMRALDQKISIGTHRGTEKQEFAKALKLIDLGADVSIVDSKGSSALHYAARMQEIELPNLKILWQKLLDAGASPNRQDKDGETPLHVLGLSKFGYKFSKESFEAFLDIVQPDTEVKDNQGLTPLFKMIDEWGNTDIRDMSAVLELLGKAGARFDVRDLRGRTLLHAAARHCRGNTAPMQLLVDRVIDPNSQDTDGNTIWHEAMPNFCRWRVSPNVFRGFKALGVDLTKTNKQGRSPLHILCEYTQWVAEEGDWKKQDDPTLLEYILGEIGVDVNLGDNEGVTPLHIASTFSPSLVQRLLRAGSDAVKTTAEGLNAFHLAARSRQSNVIGPLISWLRSQGGRNSLLSAINHNDIQGRTPLYYACASGRYDSVQFLVDAGASVDTETYSGSAWNGCADFEEEQRSADWGRWDDYYSLTVPAGGVFISDKLRPKRRPPPGGHLERFRFSDERIDEIVELLIVHGAASAEKFLDRAIKFSLEQQFDYTAMCLLRARETLGITTTLDCQEIISECVKRRETEKPRYTPIIPGSTKAINPYNFQDLSELIRMKKFDAVGKLLLDADLLDESNVYGPRDSGLMQLVKSGFASLIDIALTPEVMSKLRTVSKPQEQTARDSFYGRAEKDQEKEKLVREGEANIYSEEILAHLLETACMTERPNMEVLRVLVEKKEINVNSVAKHDRISMNSLVKDDGSGHRSVGENTVLHVLAKSDRLEWWQLHQALPFLLEQGANTEMRDGKGMTPLQLCLDKVGKPYFSKEMVKILLEAGADPYIVDNNDRSCFASAEGNREVCEMLLSHGAKVLYSALIAAIHSLDIDLLQSMLSREGVNPNMRKVGPNDTDDIYPIEYLLCDVSRRDKLDVSRRMFDILLAHGANLSAKYEHTTVIHRLLDNLGGGVEEH
ncbi:ankyrin [Karstenula rhodostoma CBS 690.94]|uniref:Ankyrin n=1 Tax=Karstenula rhodostoma CBS 690.94 TaxID=1392251 RepID=A0A9P4UDR8_9PLEO|nr:ankyrin [Karstenula rhodostoma CBS 690.94]